MFNLFESWLPKPFESTLQSYSTATIDLDRYNFILIYDDDKCIGIFSTTKVCAFIYNGSQLTISIPKNNPIIIDSTNIPTIITVSYPLLYIRSPKEALMRFTFCTQHIKSILFDTYNPTTLTVSTTDSSQNLFHDNSEQVEFMMDSVANQLFGDNNEYVIDVTNL